MAAPRRSLRLRTLGLLAFGVLALYVAAMGLYLSLVVGPASAALRRDTVPTLELFAALNQRASSLESVVAQVFELLRRRTPGDAALAAARAGLQQLPGRVGPLAFAATPAGLREPLARLDQLETRLQNQLVEVLAALQLGERTAAEEGFAAAQRLDQEVTRTLSVVQEAAFADLLAREADLAGAVDQAVVGTLAFLGIGLLLALLAGYQLVERLVQPVAQLEAALARVAAGDLTVQVPVRRDDEVGRLTRLFNDTVRGVRDRAEAQGRFAAAGQLMADVAHEVNNPLMAINALVETRLRETPADASLREDLQQVRAQARRASRLLSGLLRFVRAGEPRIEPVDVNQVVRDAAALVAYQFRIDEISLREGLDPTLPPVLADAGRLEQVLVNLLSNAVDAMRGTPTPRWLVVETWAGEGRVHFAVADSGPGIAEAMRVRLFQPFATTKGARGNGLGLYISRQIMRDGGGDLALLSSPTTTGARFVGWLPAAPAEAAPAPPERAVTPQRGTKPLEGVRVLVTEDEDTIRAPVVRFLRARGATVLEAGDGEVALRQLAHEPVDVILADLRMPRMDGAEFYARLSVEAPALADRVVFLSGDLSLAEQGGLLVPADRVLLKPVELQEIEAKVMEMLHRATEAGTPPPRP